jgi:hypothetical protein
LILVLLSWFNKGCELMPGAGNSVAMGSNDLSNCGLVQSCTEW